MVARIAVILGDDVLGPNTGRVPIMDPEIWGARREAGSGVCAVNIGICGRTRRGRRLAGRRCPRRCCSGPISGLSWCGIASSMGRCIETQVRAIDQLRRRFAATQQWQLGSKTTAAAARWRRSEQRWWQLGGGAGAAAIVSLVTLISYSRCNIWFCSIIKMEQLETIKVS